MTANLSQVLAQRPVLRQGFEEFYLELWRSPHVPVRLLELCRLRTACIHRCEQELLVQHAQVTLSQAERAAIAAGDSTLFDEAEQAALEIAERMPFAYAQIDDAAVARVKAALGDAGTVALLTALAFFDVTCRLKLVWDVPGEACQFDATCLV